MFHKCYYIIDILHSLTYIVLHKNLTYRGHIYVIKKASSSIIDFRIFILSIIALCVIFISRPVWAGTFYLCIDKAGSEIIVDSPVEGHTCTPLGTFEEKKETQSENKTAVSPDDKITKIIVKGNQVLVPVTIVHGTDEVDIHLLLDTGATKTAIHTDVADRLYINLSGAKKTKGEIVGGGIIEVNVFRMDSVKIGPKAFKNQDILIVPYEGSAAAQFDGLLGMDILGKISYKLDLEKQLIYWE